MQSLQKYIDSQAQQIEKNLTAIADLQRQLNELNQQVRIQQQINQAQKTSQVEVSKTLKSLEKLFKDICGIYPPEAIDDLVADIKEMAEKVKSNYDEYSESGRFLNGSEETEQQEEQGILTDAKNLPLIVEALPAEDDDVTELNAAHRQPTRKFSHLVGERE